MSHAALLAALLIHVSARSGGAELVAQSEGAVEVPGGVVDGARRVLYLSGEKSGVVAVNAEDGSVLWECTDASRPLVLVDQRLAVLATEPRRPNVLRVRSLDVANQGARAGESAPLIFPEWVDVDNGRNTDRQMPGPSWFQLRAGRAGEELLLHWAAGKSYFGGVRPPPEVLAAARRFAAGLAKVDLRSGGVRMESLPAEEEDPAIRGQTPVDELPQPVRDLAKREGWELARLVGARAYGQVRRTERGRVVYVLQAVDLPTGKLLWQRPIGEVLLHALPP